MKGTIYLLMGNFGVGKSSIVNFYQHKKMEGTPFTEVAGFLSLGGERGADELIKKGIRKNHVYGEILPMVSSRDVLIHSVLYQNIQDIERYSRTHNVVVIYLDTPYLVNAERIARRNPKKKIGMPVYAQLFRYAEKVRQFCIFKKIPFYRIDNARPFEIVSKEVWAILKK